MDTYLTHGMSAHCIYTANIKKTEHMISNFLLSFNIN